MRCGGWLLLLMIAGLMLTGFLPQEAQAHPISLSAAAVDVQESRVAVELEIQLEDLVLFHRLTAGDALTYSASDLRSAAEKHKKFILEYFVILDEQGDRLQGTIESSDASQIVDAGVAQADLMRRSVYYAISFPLKKAQPKFLTFLQNFGGDKAALPSVMDLHLLQAGRFTGVTEQVVHGRPHTVQLGWSNASSATRISFAELRKKRAEEVKGRLGISSYTGLFSFLYVTRFEVRHEILIPLLTLEKWIKVDRKDPDFLDVDEQAAAKSKIAAFFEEHGLVVINQKTVAGKMSRLNFFTLDINDFALNAEPRKVSVHQARVGVIVSYPTPKTPSEVVVTWDTFNDYAPFVQTAVLVGNNAPERHTFQAQATQWKWSGELSGAEITAVPATGAALTAADRAKTCQQLLGNIYSAFEYRDDEQVYDALNKSVSGKLLREIYLSIKRSLILAEQGGTVSYVTDVTIQSAEPTKGGDDSSIDLVWRVSGVSEHWGHIHTRTSEYRGKVKVVRADGAWKFEAFQLLEDKRLQFETKVRSDDPY